MADVSAEAVIGQLLFAVEEVKKYAAAHQYELCGIGIGTPGIVDETNRIVLGGAENIKGWENLPLADRIEEVAQLPVQMGNDANLMGLGRTVFYKKVRGVTGYSPNEYLRVIRLKKAAELLLTEDLTVSEISYKVGINDPYYFSKCFKNQFGIAPSVYQKNGGKAPASNDTAESTEQASEEKEEENKTDV